MSNFDFCHNAFKSRLLQMQTQCIYKCKGVWGDHINQVTCIEVKHSGKFRANGFIMLPDIAKILITPDCINQSINTTLILDWLRFKAIFNNKNQSFIYDQCTCLCVFSVRPVHMPMCVFCTTSSHAYFYVFCTTSSHAYVCFLYDQFTCLFVYQALAHNYAWASGYLPISIY